MDKNKMIIIGLVVVIVALVVGIAIMLTGNGNSSDVQVPEGMQVYDFDSAFTMVVKDDAKFLKTWDSNSLGINKKYFNKKDDYVIVYSESDVFNNLDNLISFTFNDTKKYNITEDEGLTVVKILDKNKKVSVGNSEKYFKYGIPIIEGNKYIMVWGNNLDSLKEMASTVKINGGNSDE